MIGAMGGFSDVVCVYTVFDDVSTNLDLLGGLTILPST